MSSYREVPCKYYLAYGEYEKGREANHKKYCQHFGKYIPRAKVKKINKKKQYIEKQRSKFTA